MNFYAEVLFFPLYQLSGRSKPVAFLESSHKAAPVSLLSAFSLTFIFVGDPRRLKNEEGA